MWISEVDDDYQESDTRSVKATPISQKIITPPTTSVKITPWRGSPPLEYKPSGLTHPITVPPIDYSSEEEETVGYEVPIKEKMDRVRRSYY